MSPRSFIIHIYYEHNIEHCQPQCRMCHWSECRYSIFTSGAVCICLISSTANHSVVCTTEVSADITLLLLRRYVFVLLSPRIQNIIFGSESVTHQLWLLGPMLSFRRWHIFHINQVTKWFCSIWNHHNILVTSFRFIWIPMLWVIINSLFFLTLFNLNSWLFQRGECL